MNPVASSRGQPLTKGRVGRTPKPVRPGRNISAGRSGGSGLPGRELEGRVMSAKPPTAEEIRELARESHIELSPRELDALVQALREQIPVLERVDEFAADPQPSVERYPKRDAGAPMNRKDDPLNAVMRKCH